MKIYSQNSPTLLFEKIEALGQEPHESWRSVYLKLLDQPARNNSELRRNFIVNAITDLLVESEGYIYICDDGDIFILFQGALKPVLSKLSSHFGDLDPDQLRGQAQDGVFSIFDLGKHWSGFYKLCEDKYLATLAETEELRARPNYYTPAGITRKSLETFRT